MNEQNVIKAVNLLLIFGTICLFYGLLYYVTDEHRIFCKNEIASKTEIEQEPEEEKITPIYNESLNGYYELKNAYLGLEIRYQTIEYYYLGRYFVTAYSHEETGSVMTASGAICHYSDSNFEPTTAAIDRRYHRFGDYIAVDFGDYRKVYVCEDTGSAVLGLHIDCYVLDLESVYAWDTGYYPTYSVEFVEHQATGDKRMERQKLIREYLKEKMNEVC